MKESHPRPRRLKKMTEILKQLESLSSEPIESPISSSSESIHSLDKPTKKPKKNQAPKLKTFNKLLDLNTYKDELTVEEFEYLRDQPLELEHSSKPCKKQLSPTAFKDSSVKSSYPLVKSVLTNKDTKDSLIVNDPVKVSGFFSKNQSQNSRELFREGLRSQINSRKTTHIDSEGIFDKPITDFDKRENVPSEVSLSSFRSAEGKSDEIKSAENSKSVMSKLVEGKNDEIKSAENSKNDLNRSVEGKNIEVKSAQNSKNVLNFASYISTSNSSPVYVPRAEKKKFIDEEAEKSGDEHSSDTLEEDSQEFLEGLINDEEVAADENYEKHLKDMMEKEEKELRMVVNGEFKRKMNEKIISATKKIKYVQQTLQPKSKVFSKALEEFDEDSKIIAMKELRGIKSFLSTQKSSLIFDEKSNNLLKLLSKPEPAHVPKSLLSQPAPIHPSPKPQKPFFILKK